MGGYRRIDLQANTARQELQQILAKEVVNGGEKESTSVNPTWFVIPNAAPVNVEVIWEPLTDVPTAAPPKIDPLNRQRSWITFRVIDQYQKLQGEPIEVSKEGTKKYFQLVEQLDKVSPEQVDRLARESAWKRHKKQS